MALQQIRWLHIFSVLITGSLIAEPAVQIRTSAHATAMAYGDTELWTYQHDPGEGKPYFHPLNAANGALLSELRPQDHPWHRGLWFSWKYINGVNYWEENRETGRSDGLTRLISTQREIDDSQQVIIRQALDYAPVEVGTALLRETRTLVLSPPDSAGCYTIDWSSEFRALQPVELSRTPIPGEPDGKRYGGYAGLSMRLNKAFIGGRFLTADGEFKAKGFDHTAARWMIFNSEPGASLLIMDHAENPRAPTKWYVAPKMPFYSPALLFDAPLQLNKGEVLSLRYRIVVSPEPIIPAQAALRFSDWVGR